jgi:protein-tyrosine phosphatase
VYRSNHLASLTASDYQYLNARGIKLVCDLRSDSERKRAPTMWQGNSAPEILSAPIIRHTDVMLTSGRLRQLSAPGSSALADSYVRMISEGSEQYGVVLRRLAYGPLPSVTHCSAGKDRTGVFSAILLTILGVSRQVIVEDYLLTSTYMLEDEALRRVQMDWQKVSGTSESPSMDMLRAAYTMTDAPLLAAFDAIDRLHGSFEMFTRDRLQLTAKDITALHGRLLE